MVTLPKEFVALEQPGYFWNLTDQTLYSCKVTGALKPLRLSCLGTMDGGRWHPNRAVPGYWLSNKKKRKFVPLTDLKALQSTNSVFPIYKA